MKTPDRDEGRVYVPPPYPPAQPWAPPAWQDPGPPPWQTAIRVNRLARARALRVKRARWRAFLRLFRRRTA